ncbi:hypothetical protein GETHED_01860 [Geothrix edaphica]|uniref:Uncharacterized protein n=1 Tax=Geothrix edaphica TaxID=2927976 RepID=A0ABQ5PTX1_9BACT|nr:hypothetical protein GETHED_01860 [Geothrix edaphica]
MVWAWHVGQWPAQVQEQTGRVAFGAGGGAGTVAAMAIR